MLEGDDPGGGAFRQLICPYPGEFAQFFSKNANARGLAREGGGWALLELTDALFRLSTIAQKANKVLQKWRVVAFYRNALCLNAAVVLVIACVRA